MIDSIRSMPRLEPIARRSRSASSPVQSPIAIAISISCSWNSGTPRVRSSTGSSDGCGVGDLLAAGRPADVGVHRAALDRPGTDQRDLDRQVVEARAAAAGAACRSGHGSRPGRPRSSRPGRACRRPPAPPWGSSSQRPSARRRCSSTIAHHVVERAEHAEPEQVELDQPHELAGVLVPLQHRALVHAGPLDRHTSPIGRSVRIIPPEWMPRWRGAFSSWSARSTTGGGTTRSPSSRPIRGPARRSAWTRRPAGRASSPSALAASRIAILGR